MEEVVTEGGLCWRQTLQRFGRSSSSRLEGSQMGEEETLSVELVVLEEEGN
jgi:hypothetical protein